VHELHSLFVWLLKLQAGAMAVAGSNGARSEVDVLRADADVLAADNPRHRTAERVLGEGTELWLRQPEARGAAGSRGPKARERPVRRGGERLHDGAGHCRQLRLLTEGRVHLLQHEPVDVAVDSRHRVGGLHHREASFTETPDPPSSSLRVARLAWSWRPSGSPPRDAEAAPLGCSAHAAR
jgi:hypothetical protein